MTGIITSQKNLVDTLDKELEEEEAAASQESAEMAVLPEGCAFVAGPKDPNSSVVYNFVNDLGDEKITISLNLNRLLTEDEHREHDEESSQEEVTHDEDEHDLGGQITTLPVDITLEKKGQKTCRIEARIEQSYTDEMHSESDSEGDDLNPPGYATDIEITGIMFGEGEITQDSVETTYSGPEMGDLDPDLHDKINEYLNERGFDRNFGQFLVMFAYEEEQKLYRKWLSDFKAYTSA